MTDQVDTTYMIGYCGEQLKGLRQRVLGLRKNQANILVHSVMHRQHLIDRLIQEKAALSWFDVGRRAQLTEKINSMSDGITNDMSAELIDELDNLLKLIDYAEERNATVSIRRELDQLLEQVAAFSWRARTSPAADGQEADAG